ncbi:hypothetical protein [Microbacterium sp. CPCC 204701]|uniref:hypothetical protein n=1 Tax=Microbacterium sp. CPCC 204701 TaxID=2493084 RepID=UPI000FD78A5B|nr:hypothetical protein [Microbacterium sp. CPCC 204701]
MLRVSLTTLDPTPIPVYIVDPAPEWWSPEWWIDAGIPLLGAVGSFAVAIAAVVVTWRLARRDHADRARAKRAEFAYAVNAYLHPRHEPERGKFAAAQTFQRRENDLRAAAGADDNAPRIAGWIFQQESLLMERNAVASFQGDRDERQSASELYIFGWEVTNRVHNWVSTGQMDFDAIDYSEDLEPVG